MKNTFFTLLTAFLASILPLTGQNIAPADSTGEAVALRETVVSAAGFSQARSAVAQEVKVLRRSDIERLNAQSTADLLQNSGAVFVQKSQQGGGSPVLRGFEASRVLLVVDGVRMNNAIYRAGHLQNAITMDNAALDRAEVLFGPASTVYGTDALGGAICFFTKNPTFSEGGFKTTGSAFARYGTVNDERTGHADFSLGGRRLAVLTSLTFSDFGDLRMGEKEKNELDFTLRRFYVERIGGKDSLVQNSDPYVQKFSGYQQYDFLEKIVFRPNENVRHTLNVQFSNSSDIPRYDRLTDPRSGGGLNSAEWYYGPQRRLMAAYALGMLDWGWFNGGLQATLSFQDIEESRHNRNFGGANRTSRIENVKVGGFVLNAVRRWGGQSLRVGLDAQYNDVRSKASRFNLNTSETTAQSTRYPDGGSQMTNASVYATHHWEWGQWAFSEGARVGFSSLRAEFVRRDFFQFPFDAVGQSSPLASGSLGAVWNGWKSLRAALSASSGFRMPNVDDLGKVFDSQPGRVIVPNPDIGPEKTFNLDLNLTYRVSDRVRWENMVWTTALCDAIVTDVFQFNGQDSIDYDGVRSEVLANQNKRKARLWGFSSGLEADATRRLAVFGSIAYTKGEVLASEGDNTPLDHIPPLYGRVGARWHTKGFAAEGFALFNGKKAIEDYNLEGEDNPQYAPAGGMPAWGVVHLRVSYQFGKWLTVQAGVDNVLDKQYRAFASGINGPGRNVWLTLRTAW
jgi:hemoglobin/transferrin/lactoferrin receptor protein